MQRTLMLAAALVLAAGCNQGETYESGGDVDTAGASTSTIPDYDVDLRKDTLNVPVFGTQKDTIIVDKPVISGKKPVEVKRPTITRDTI